MNTEQLTSTTGGGQPTIVVGASRGLGRGIACALADIGTQVIAVSRTAPGADVANIRTEVADATDADTARRLLDTHDASGLVLVAGASPLMRPLHHHTWESFSDNWHTDVKIAFHWLRAALLRPLRPGSRIVVISSGAALAGSPLSGGYAGAKATQRLITGYARDEADRAGLDITLTAVLPRITPLTDLGRAAVQAYAARGGQSEDDYLRQLGGPPPLTPEVAGRAVVELLQTDARSVAAGYLLTGAGLRQLAE